ncbi:hypothetical protein B0H16DRAFT_1899197 [Mycena metata]|uniref:Uncharacterized protein n=1 Tax=Mycena metata TaxID=1033252 RepID=A0AAD7H7D5_9AGAR|nr:hypothetical protein B0H16DRAFT_1702940 [Mycena metata]KAJ7714223.1 hypothetical protein B0H16DRAFT_1899197 [Mycena metata]
MSIPVDPLEPIASESFSALKGDVLRHHRDNLADVAASLSLWRDLSKLRSALPCLRQFTSVQYHFGDHFLLLFLNSVEENIDTVVDVPLYIGQRPVYLTHGAAYNSGIVDIPRLGDVDPRALMSDEDVNLIKKHFLHAHGIRIHVWGFVDIFFRDLEALERQRALPLPRRIGGLPFDFIIGEHWPTSDLVNPSNPLPPRPSSPSRLNAEPSLLPSIPVISMQSSSCTGVKISFEGKDYITTTSHAWVSTAELRETRRKRLALQKSVPKEKRESDFALRKKAQLEPASRRPRRRFLVVKFGKWVERVLQVLRGSGRTKISTPLNVKVYLEASENKPIGRITRTFDQLSQHIAGSYLNLFPNAFTHDLSLIEAEDGDVLPRMVVPPWHPIIHPQFAPPEMAIRFKTDPGSPCKPKVHPAFILNYSTKAAKEVLIDGVDYFFDAEQKQITRSFIWRTQKETESDYCSSGGSGSVVYLGQPTDEQVRALVFQNYQTTVTDKTLGGVAAARRYLGLEHLVTFKGGFLLPKAIEEHARIKVEREEEEGSLSCNVKRTQ